MERLDMRPTRRRVLRLAAACVALPALASPGLAARRTWRGTALGADAEIVLEGGDETDARAAIRSVQSEIERLEAVFSLYRHDSALSRLNRTGRLVAPPHDLVACLSLAGDIHRLTRGYFDPTVQPLFEAAATWFATEHRPPPDGFAAARALIGFDRVRFDTAEVVLPPGGRLTLNGIAQGWITDRAAELLASHGYACVFADVGEVRAMGPSAAGPWRVGLAGGGHIDLTRGALAVSAPDGLRFRGGPLHHLFDPLAGRSADLWQRVVAVAPTAAEADALATGLAAAPASIIEHLVRRRGDITITARDESGVDQRY